MAFTKEAWAAAGGYPEWIDYCEDLIFDFRLRDAAGPFAWAPDAVAHFRPRGSLKAFFKQYYRYARGDGKADLWRKKHLIRYVTYLIALPGLIALSLLHSPGWWFVLLAGVMLYCATPYRRLRPQPAELAPMEQVKAVTAGPRDSRGWAMWRRCWAIPPAGFGGCGIGEGRRCIGDTANE